MFITNMYSYLCQIIITKTKIMKATHSFNYRGFDFDFKYNYTSGSPATWEHPAEYEDYEIYAITLNGIDADDLIDPMYDDFIDEAIKDIKSYYE